MDFHVQLLKIEQALCKDETEALAFLCRDIIDTDLSKVASASHLFTKLKNMDLLEEEDYFIVAELLYRIRQFYLIKKMGKSKEQVEKELPQKGKISNYRQLLYDLSEDVTRDDLKSVKFLLQNNLPRCRLEDDMASDFAIYCTLYQDQLTMLKLLIEMEKEDLLDQSNLEMLEKVLQIISPSLVKKITKYKNENDELEPPHPSSGFSSVNTDVIVGHGESADSDPWISETYAMNREKRGYCLIINNYNFSESRTRSSSEQKCCTDRHGTNTDARALKDVFQWLGFDTVCVEDLTRKEILKEIEQYQNLTDHKDRDCFMCCILSHGEKGKIYGTDGRTVLINEITKPFSGKNCHLLIGKPKVFFIQACQGQKAQLGLPIEADSYTSELEEDALVPDSIPEDADFLVGMATVEDYVSFRDTSKGTWYIQSLCQNLLHLVPRGEDLLSILTKVNMDVSRKTDEHRIKKQIPQPAFSLRKKLVFPIPAERPPALLQL
ncbi:UNVERIFIED_CONTAM: hypothetical protein FKN15_041838 [Acipenser sinensis]